MTMRRTTATPRPIAAHEATIKQAQAVLRANRRHLTDKGRNIWYTCPARGWYDQQWLWDSCFHAIALSTFDPGQAQRELEALLAKQRPDGFLPNVLMWYRPHSLYNRLFRILLFKDGASRITQPPVLAAAVEALYARTGQIEVIRMLLPKIKLYYDWLARERSTPTDPLVAVIHPWETGLDSTPAYDSLLHVSGAQPGIVQAYLGFYRLLLLYRLVGWKTEKIFRHQWFVAKDATFNSIYVLGLYALARLSKQVGEHTDAAHYQELAGRVEQAMIARMWNANDGLFYNLDSQDRQLYVPTIASIFPIVLPNLPKEMADALVQRHLTNAQEFWTAYPVPSVPADSPYFNPATHQTVLWRGPTWINTNWYLIKALQAKGYRKIAAELLEKTVGLVDAQGFYEYYNPLTGAPLGQKNFGWSTLVLDLLADRQQ